MTPSLHDGGPRFKSGQPQILLNDFFEKGFTPLFHLARRKEKRGELVGGNQQNNIREPVKGRLYVRASHAGIYLHCYEAGHTGVMGFFSVG